MLSLQYVLGTIYYYKEKKRHGSNRQATQCFVGRGHRGKW